MSNRAINVADEAVDKENAKSLVMPGDVVTAVEFFWKLSGVEDGWTIF